jgi:hypothetical protein
VELTPDDVGDVSELSGLVDQIDGDVASLAADGAYDGEAAYDAVADRHPPLRSSFRRGPQQFRTRLRRRSVIGILQRLKSIAAWAGNAVLAIIVGAWLKLRSIVIRPSLTGDFKPGP